MMFYVSPKGKYQKRYLQSHDNKQKVQLTIQYILVINPHQRTEKDHQQVFYYFKDHQFFTQIQRLKSFRAKILCMSAIILIPVQEFKQQTHFVLQKFSKSKQMAVIQLQTKLEIMKEDETIIKQNMNKLKQYSLINRLGYNQILYLSCFVEEFTPKYKEYLYKQNQQVNLNFIYLIESGEFQIFKNIQLNIQQLQNSRLSKKASKSRLQQYLEFQASPYKQKNKRIRDEQVYIVEGGCGQSIGQIQFFLSKDHRIYSVKCNSSNNKVLKFHVKHFKSIFQSNQKLFNKIKREFSERQDYQVKNIQSKCNLKQSKSKQKFDLGKYASQVQKQTEKSFSLDLKEGLLSKKYRTIGDQKIQLNFRYAQGNNHNPEASAFILQDNLLPKIDKFGRSQVRRKQNRFSGLIDSSFLIKQKQSVIKKKYPIKKFDKDIFKFNKNQNSVPAHLPINSTSSKSSKNENRNVAHSKSYMKNLLVDALKKSGYINEDQITQKISFHNDFQKQKLKYRVESKATSAHQHTYQLIIQLEKRAQQQMQERIRQENKLLNKKQRRSLASNNFDRFFFKQL